MRLRVCAIALALATANVSASEDARSKAPAGAEYKVGSPQQHLTDTLKKFKEAQARRDQIRASGATRQQIAAAEDSVRALQRELRAARSALREARDPQERARPAQGGPVKTARADTRKVPAPTTRLSDPAPARARSDDRANQNNDAGQTVDATAPRAEILREKERLRAQTAAAQAKARQQREALAPLKQETSRIHSEARAAQDERRRQRDAQRSPPATSTGSLNNTPAPEGAQARPLLEGH